MTIADRIQKLRKTKGISQEELAEHVGVSRQAVSKWESNQSTPDVEKIILLSQYFEVTTDYLLKGTELSERNGEAFKQTEKRKDTAHILNITATALNLLGIVISCFIWSETVSVGPVIAGVVFLILGMMVHLIGITSLSGREKVLARCRFWKLNIWLVLFLPLAVIWNSVTVQMPAPYPLVYENAYHLFAIFWILYFFVCGVVVRSCIKTEKDDTEET